MDRKSVIKIKDSVDLFLSNKNYLMVYYINTRQKKSFRINAEMIHLLENIDGEKTVEDLINIMKNQYDVSSKYTAQIIEKLQNNRIVTEIITNQTFLSPHLLEKYKRQINYFAEFFDNELKGIIAQKKIIDSHILIFGCGAIGGNIALQLAMAGVGHLTLFDSDTVESSDVSRHMFFRNTYIGQSKLSALKNELELINPSIQVALISDYLNPTTDITELIKKSDFVINTLDEPYIGYTSSKISRICVKYNIPHYIAGGFDAHLASTGELIIPYITPCVECYATHFKKVLKNWKPKKHPVTTRYTEIGGLASLSLFSSSYACIEIIKYIAGLVEMPKHYKVRGEFLFYDMSLTYLHVEKNPQCPVCGGANKNES